VEVHAVLPLAPVGVAKLSLCGVRAHQRTLYCIPFVVTKAPSPPPRFMFYRILREGLARAIASPRAGRYGTEVEGLWGGIPHWKDLLARFHRNYDFRRKLRHVFLWSRKSVLSPCRRESVPYVQSVRRCGGRLPSSPSQDQGIAEHPEP
jgi:hypothetical protein